MEHTKQGKLDSDCFERLGSASSSKGFDWLDLSDTDSDPDCPRLVDEVETDDGGPERELTRDFGGFNLNRTPPANGTC